MPNVNQSPLISSFALALTALAIASGAHAQLLSFDFDGDGVPDEEDLCPLTTDLTGPIPTETLCEGCLSDAETVQGCNAEDVLACKPGPNYHDRKFGVPARVVDKFINKLAWAKNCSYDPPPPPPPPETSGTASDVDELLLNLPGASFTVPPAALPDGTPVTFSYESASVIEPDLLGPSETVITLVYSLAFSVQQQADETMTLDIEVPAGITDGIYAFIRVTSDLSNDTPSSAEWVPLPGEYDSNAGRFRVGLGATGELFSIFVVTRTDSSSTTSMLQKLEARLATLQLWMEGAMNSVTDLFRASTAFAGQTIRGELRERGWVAFCRPERLPPEDLELCQPGSPTLQALADAMYDAAVNLNDRGLLGPAVLYSELRQYMESTKLPFATSEPVGFPPSDEYYVVYMNGSNIRGSGTYWNPPGLIAVRADSITNATPIHEIFHSVSAADCPRSVKKQWIDESHAAAVETWDPSWAGAASEWRYLLIDEAPVWRNWELPLNRPRGGSAAYQDLAPYTLAELWLEADPGLLYVPNLVNGCAVLPTEVPTADEYVQYDSWMQAAGGPPLPDAFVSVIEKRAADDDYPYCGALLDPNNPEGPRVLVDPVECTTAPCELNETLDLALQRMTAKCFRPLVTLPPSDECPGEEIYTVQFGGDPDVNRYILDGTAYEPGDTIQDAPAAFKLWALDKGVDNPLAFSEGSVLIDSECPPPPPPSAEVRLLTQRHFVRVEAALGGIFLPAPYCASPYRIAEAVTTYSSEDGLNESYRRTTRTEWDYFSCTGLNYLCPSTSEDVPIDPIGFGTVSEALSLSVESVGDLRPNQTACQSYYPVGTGQASSVSYGVNTQPSADGTGIVLEGLIESTLTATTPAKPPCVDDCNGDGAATGLYDITFQVDGPVNITLNYSCSATSVGLRGAGGDLLSLRHWNQGRELEDWTCEPYSAELTPDGNPYRLIITGGSDNNVDPDVQGRNQTVSFSVVIGGGDTGGVSVSSAGSSP